MCYVILSFTPQTHRTVLGKKRSHSSLVEVDRRDHDNAVRYCREPRGHTHFPVDVSHQPHFRTRPEAVQDEHAKKRSELTHNSTFADVTPGSCRCGRLHIPHSSSVSAVHLGSVSSSTHIRAPPSWTPVSTSVPLSPLLPRPPELPQTLSGSDSDGDRPVPCHRPLFSFISVPVGGHYWSPIVIMHGAEVIRISRSLKQNCVSTRICVRPITTGR